jgi:hypothetical protein
MSIQIDYLSKVSEILKGAGPVAPVLLAILGFFIIYKFLNGGVHEEELSQAQKKCLELKGTWEIEEPYDFMREKDGLKVTAQTSKWEAGCEKSQAGTAVLLTGIDNITHHLWDSSGEFATANTRSTITLVISEEGELSSRRVVQDYSQPPTVGYLPGITQNPDLEAKIEKYKQYWKATPHECKAGRGITEMKAYRIIIACPNYTKIQVLTKQHGSM